MKKSIKAILIFLGIIIILLFIVRANSLREIDDINPLIPCEKEYLEKTDILWAIPLYQGKPNSENKKWCEEIKALNKTIGMHGIRHTYHEFEDNLSQQQIQEGMKIFEECFGFKPELFKPPQLAISEKNKELLKYNELKHNGFFNQLTHKVYHCNNTGVLSNEFHDVF